MIRGLICIALLLSASAYAEDVIAVVDLKFIKDTGEPASTLCFEQKSKDASCHTWSTFYLFEARVKKVISGNPASSKFPVWFGTHALKKGNIRNAVVKLRPLPPEHNARYQIVAIGEKKAFYCFSLDEDAARNESSGSAAGIGCYEAEP